MAWQAGLAWDARPVHAATSGPPPTSWSPTAPPTGSSAGRSRPASRPPRWPMRWPAWPRPRPSRRCRGTPPSQRLFLATADDFRNLILAPPSPATGRCRRSRTSSGCHKTGDPNSGLRLHPGQRRPDQLGPALGHRPGLPGAGPAGRAAGQRPAGPNSLAVLDSNSVATPSGTGYDRYGTSRATTATATATASSPSYHDCTANGAAVGHQRQGHRAPVAGAVRGERPSTTLAGRRHRRRPPLTWLHAELGLRRRAWCPSRSGTTRTCPPRPTARTRPPRRSASPTARPDGSAAPLTWAQAQELRLIRTWAPGRDVETPAVTVRRYMTHGPPGSLPLDADRARRRRHAGRRHHHRDRHHHAGRAGGRRIGRHHHRGRAATVTTVRGRSGGSFSATVPVGFGDDAITATATAMTPRAVGAPATRRTR